MSTQGTGTTPAPAPVHPDRPPPGPPGAERFTLATNQPGREVDRLVSRHLYHLVDTYKHPPEVRIATAYFNLAGWTRLADALKNVVDAGGRVRLLLGAEPDPHQSRRTAEPGTDDLPGRLDAAERLLRRDRNLLGFNRTTDEQARRLIDWLEHPGVQVRRYQRGFLHGKTVIFGTAAAMVGSSNLTLAGLTTNQELNLADYDPRVVGEVIDWFDTLWELSEPYDLADLYRERFEPHSPWRVFLQMLYEQYGTDPGEDPPVPGTLLTLTEFQQDGVRRALRHLDRYGGTLIADDVGLGKTHIAGRIIDHYVRQRRALTLVIAPAALRDGPWREFLDTYGLPVEIRSFEEVAADTRLNPDLVDAGNRLTSPPPPGAYSLVVIDEAHHLRNPRTRRWRAVRRLLTDTPRKSVVLLTATPVNNTIMDAYWLLRLFVPYDQTFADRGVPSLHGLFRRVAKHQPDDVTASDLFEVLDAVTVRRTRGFVRRHYPDSTIDGEPVRFPTPILHRVDYQFSDPMDRLLDRLTDALGARTGSSRGRELTLARYQPSRYRLTPPPGDPDDTTDDSGDPPTPGKATQNEHQLAGLLRSLLLKRFESSTHAFAQTCRSLLTTHEHMLRALDAGKVLTGRTLTEFARMDFDDLDDPGIDDDPAEPTEPTGYDTDRLRKDLTGDLEVLRELLALAEQVTGTTTTGDDTTPPAGGDPKLAALVDTLVRIAATNPDDPDDPGARDRRKTIVFTYFRDTATWVHDQLTRLTTRDPRLAPWAGRLALVTGDTPDHQEVLSRFAPRSAGSGAPTEDDCYDLLITTDVLAEGVNLQQARNIINYDLPWNPMRIAQRHGRIDRIRSPHDTVHLYCFFPAEKLDELLNLEERLRRKLRDARAAVGTGQVLPGVEAIERNYADLREQIEHLHNENVDVLWEYDDVGLYLGEEFRQLLRSGPPPDPPFELFPWGSGSGFRTDTVSRPTWVFCARVGDRPHPEFRVVTTNRTTGEPVCDGDADHRHRNLLAALITARPPAGEHTQRHMPDDGSLELEATYAAWRAAREDIRRSREAAADPARRTPAGRKVLRRAVQLVDRVRGPGSDLARRLWAVWPDDDLGPLRCILDHRDLDDTRKVSHIEQFADRMGLVHPPDPGTPDPVRADDINLVCWMMISPQAGDDQVQLTPGAPEPT